MTGEIPAAGRPAFLLASFETQANKLRLVGIRLLENFKISVLNKKCKK